MVICHATIVVLAAKPAIVKKEYISVEDAEHTGAIHLKIFSNGMGHCGYCIDMEISNMRHDSGYYHLEAGRRLHPTDSTAQDILVTKGQNIPLAAGEKKHLTIFGFCCQEHHHGPIDKSTYSVGHMADAELVELAQYLNENRYPISSMQFAVWVISDHNLLSSITGSSMDSTTPLRETVAKIAHLENTWYWITYENDTARLFSGRHSNVSGSLKYYVPSNTIVNISIYDSYGTLVKTLSNCPANSDSYTYNMSLDVKGWLKGKYYVRVTQDDVKSVEKTFEL
jgi:hypothetical protein